MPRWLAGSIGAVTIVVTAVLSILGSVTVNTFFVSGGLLALERIGALPAWFGAIRGDTGLPRNAALLTCLLLISQSEVRAWTGLAIAVGIGFAVKFVAGQAIPMQTSGPRI